MYVQIRSGSANRPCRVILRTGGCLDPHPYHHFHATFPIAHSDLMIRFRHHFILLLELVSAYAPQTLVFCDWPLFSSRLFVP